MSIYRIQSKIHQIFIIIDPFLWFWVWICVHASVCAMCVVCVFHESLNMSYRFAAFPCIFHRIPPNIFNQHVLLDPNENPLSYFSFIEDRCTHTLAISPNTVENSTNVHFNAGIQMLRLINKCTKSPFNVIMHIKCTHAHTYSKYLCGCIWMCNLQFACFVLLFLWSSQNKFTALIYTRLNVVLNSLSFGLKFGNNIHNDKISRK